MSKDHDKLIHSVYGFDIPMSTIELMQAEERRTKIQELKRWLGDKYLLAPLTKKIKQDKK